MKNQFKVEFLGIGAAKSGTTWLADMLRQHPGIFLPQKKELDYFSRFAKGLRNPLFDKPLSWYARFFKTARPGQLKGEISPSYLSDDVAARKIFEHNPDVKLIAMLRNPVDRAYSHYLFHIDTAHIEGLGFEEAIKERPLLLSRGNYAEQLQKYFDLFPRENIKVFLYDDLLVDPAKVLEETERFLGIPPFIPGNLHQKSNVTRYPRKTVLNKVLRKTKIFLIRIGLRPVVTLLQRLGVTKHVDATLNKEKEKPCMDQKTREILQAHYAEGIRALEKTLGRDLSAWLARHP